MKPEKKFMPIKGKILIIFGCFIFLMLLFLWLLQTVFLESFYKLVKTQNARSSTLAVVDNIDHENLKVLIERLQYEEDVNIQIFDVSGEEQLVLAQTPHPSVRLSPEILSHLIQIAEKTDKPYTELIQLENFRYPNEENNLFVGNVPPPAKNQIQTTVCAMMTTNADGQQLLVVACAPISPIDSITETLQIQLIFISFILLAIFFLLAHVLSKQIAEPIVHMNHAAQKLAAGNYQEDFSGEGYQEIAELSATLNYAARELGKVEKLRQELIANVSHDLRTPLTMIKGYSEIMRDIPGENTPENIQIIIDETTRLNSLVTDMLDLSKLQAGVMDLTPIRFNLTESIRTILTRYVKLIEQEHYKIIFSAAEDVWVVADELKISQVVYNLINNAIHYTGADKKVTITQTVREKTVRIAVSDTGQGISEEQKPYIWQRYYRIDQTHKRSAIGSGLGLFIVKNVLDLHGARYGVDSCEGKGSVFWFELQLDRL